MPPVIVGVAAYYAAAGVVTTAAAIAIGIGAAALTYAATPDVSGMSYSNAASSQQQMIRSPNEPRRYVYGRAMVSGPMVFASESGSDNKYLHLVVPVATHRCDAIEAVYFDDEVAWSSDGGMASDYASKARVKVHLGDQTAADADLVAECSEWTSDHVGYSVAYFYVRLEFDTTVFPNGVPNIKALVRGKPIYDPRLDTTVGGSGSHRWDDESTWQWTNNWGLCVLDFTRFSSGVGATQDEIDLDSFASAANDSDQTVAADDDTTEPRFTCNGTWQADQTPSTILEQMLTAALGTHVYVYGQYRLYAGVYQGPPVITLTEDDAAGQITVRPYTPRSELCNAVSGTFIDPGQAYQSTDFPPVESAELQAEDNGEYISDDLDLPFTNSVWTAQRLAKLYLLLKRSGLQITFPIKMIGLSVSVGRIVTIDLPSLNLSGVFRVDDWSFEMGKPVQLVLSYHTAELFENADTGGTPLVPANPVNYPDASVVPAPSGVAFTAYEADDSLLGQLTWNAPGGSSSYRYRVEISSGDFLAYQANPSGTVLPLPRLDAGTYSVQVWAINLFGNKSNNPAEIELAVDTAPAVTGIETIASLFELAIYPRTAVATATSTVFEIMGGSTDDRAQATALGTGKTVVWPGLRSNTTYYLWARTVNDYGISAWYGPVAAATSADSAALAESLEGQIGKTQLAQELLAEVEKIPLLEGQIGELVGAPDWDPEAAYTTGEYVKEDGVLYQATQDVPEGTAVTNTTYWKNLGAYESVTEQLQAIAVQLSDVSNTVDTVEGQMTATASRTDTLVSMSRDSSDEGRLSDVLAAWSAKSAIRNEQVTRTTEKEAFAQQVSQVQAEMADNSAVVQETSEATASLESGLNAMWKVSLGVTSDGVYYGGGFGAGIENTGAGFQSYFAVLASNFYVLNQVSGTTTLKAPFVVKDGTTFINSAVIDQADIINLIITGVLKSGNYVAGQQGIKIDFVNSTMDINGSKPGVGRVNISVSDDDLVGMQVFDANGVRRARFGIWS
ncbi:TipJ family phage tail tip protein [Gallaecimonas mangrovi]|uniref:host specificity protein J n=1 Tax=Gallaecimonas mangrovi TaxID=2291597 RepID=UPI0018666BDF|nr:DUF1983 domain-containing protein [Gallaecimonas mangrovi]